MKDNNNDIQELSFQKDGAEDFNIVRLDNEVIPEGYTPITLPESSKEELLNAFSAATSVVTHSAIVSQTANGLYRATVNPVQLIRYSDGTTGSIIKVGGKIKGHSGFAPVSGEVFTPLFIFQLASIVTGQYYMHGISKQLKALQKSINQLQESINQLQESVNQLQESVNDFRINLEIEKQSCIAAAYKALKQYCGYSVNTIDDLAQIQLYTNKMQELYLFYLQKIKDFNDNAFMFNETEEEHYYVSMCFNAYKMFVLSKLVYLKALASVSLNHKEYRPKIADVFKDLEQKNDDIIMEIFNSYSNRANHNENNGSIKLANWLHAHGRKGYVNLNGGQKIEFGQIPMLINNARQKIQNQMDFMNNEIETILQPIHKKHEILIHVQDGETRLYRLENHD